MANTHEKPIRVAILGASGYTGAELIRLLRAHPHVVIAALTGDSQAGKPMGEAFTHLSALDMPLQRHEEVDFGAIDLVFCCLPHGTTQDIIAGLPEHVRIVDLSADFRLHDLSAYEAWYGHAHRAPALQTKAVYGLTEHARDAVRAARLVANPGCYPTCSLLPILPLVKEKLIAPDRLIIDAMSGVSGAGRKAAQAMLFCEVNEGVRAYGVGGHRHVAEMEQEVSRVAGQETAVSFTAHLVPMNRGMSATIHTHVPEGVKAKDLRAALALRYANEPFVRVCADGVIPSTQEVRGTNECRIAVVDDRRSGKAILVSVIDNLVKGASGQAIQNLNVMYGWPETTGLQQYALYP